MARLLTNGFELNSATDGMEFTITGSPTISSSTVRSGAYAGRISSLSSGTQKRFRRQFVSSNLNTVYARFYVRFAAFPSAKNMVACLVGTGPTNIVRIYVDNNGTLSYDNTGDGGFTYPYTGSNATNFNLNQWYRVEVFADKSASPGSHVLTIRVDGVDVITKTGISISNGFALLALGGNLLSEAQTTGDWFFDDVAVNDTTGTDNNSWCGEGKVVVIRPSATGDSNAFSRGGADSGSNWGQVDETPPNDVTDYVESNTLNQEDLYNFADPSIPVDAFIKNVSVGVRYRSDNASSTPTFKLELLKASGGTILQSSGITPASTTWLTNANAQPLNDPIIRSKDPDGDNWNINTLKSLQAGYKVTTGNTNKVQISAIFVTIEYDDTKLFSPTKGALSFGESTPTNGEVAISFQTFGDGSGGIPTIAGDPDYGKISLITGNQARSKVYDFGDSNSRQYTIQRDLYGTGSGSVDIYIRGSNTLFDKDDASPSWTAYTIPTVQSWRYVQIRIVGA